MAWATVARRLLRSPALLAGISAVLLRAAAAPDLHPAASARRLCAAATRRFPSPTAQHQLLFLMAKPLRRAGISRRRQRQSGDVLKSVFCIATSQLQVDSILGQLEDAGFSNDAISVLYPDRKRGHQSCTPIERGHAILPTSAQPKHPREQARALGPGAFSAAARWVGCWERDPLRFPASTPSSLRVRCLRCWGEPRSGRPLEDSPAR